MGPQRRMGIYVGYDSPTIIKYLEPTTGDLFKARVTKSYIPAANAPIRIDVQEGHDQVATSSKTRLKRGRPIGSKDKNLRKLKKGALDETVVPYMNEPKEPNNDARDAELHGPEVLDNNEISTNYVMSGKQWNRKDVDINEIFAYKVALEIMDTCEDLEPTSIYECTQRNDWIKWKEAINVELNSLKKKNVFGPIIRTPLEIKPVGHKWVFVRKRNENNEIVRHKARLVAQGFTQRP
ncbi:Retrovirus-related Pol polyprotein from transposon RE2 [Cardamine amara subsp. amara]|uniref:Retrovirus-related Pol polyprotein from transposon RE2 n=1 Tax=Cardamine amara subsp. amara TaxID=228776 RepID=A0ABD0ZK07_CARAN